MCVHTREKACVVFIHVLYVYMGMCRVCVLGMYVDVAHVCVCVCVCLARNDRVVPACGYKLLYPLLVCCSIIPNILSVL